MLTAGAGFVLLSGLSHQPAVPLFGRVLAEYRTSDVRLLDRRRRVLHELRVNDKARRLEWTPLAAISPALIQAVIAAEDHRFYNHRGVDWLGVSSAAWRSLWSSRPSGASTISMQLASLLDPRLAPRDGRRTVRQKIAQVKSCLALERNWTKAEILEAYLNLASFRGEIQGVAAASRGLFRKDPHGIDREEAVVLAALLRSPNADATRVVRRAQAVGQVLGWSERGERVREKAETALRGLYHVAPVADYAPHAAWKLLRNRAGGQPRASMVSTLDLDVQLFAREALRNRLQSLKSQNVEDAALLVVENESGEVLAYLGNDGRRTTARFVDGTEARRQAGSILKPFLYALAFDQRLLTPASLLEDTPLDIPVLGGIYRPQNYDDQFHGLVTARQALASSLNVPAVRALGLVGVDPFLGTLRNLGFAGLEQSEFYGPSLALGSADVTLRNLVDAYRALANRGVYQRSRLTPGEAVPDPGRVFSAEAAFLAADILSDREGRELTFGLENPLATRFWTAVKTGTSKDMRDNWCVGFSEHYTVGVWVGNFSGAPMWHVSGISGAAPLWLEVMDFLHRNRSSNPPTAPPSLKRVRTQFPGLWSPREEYFMQGTEAPVVKAPEVAPEAKILYPANGTIFALDPDIPPGRQLVFFEAGRSAQRVGWRLDRQALPEVGTSVRWEPKPGRHRLELENSNGEILDSVEFEVRGN